MKIDLEFSKFAYTYERYNIIQEQVADEVIRLLKNKPKKILDLGCGRGALAKRINWEVEHLLGVDFAKNMLELHPKAPHIECIYANFDDPTLYEHLFLYNFDAIISASALQWSSDMDALFRRIARLHFQEAVFAIFTSNTFVTLHQTAKVMSPLRDKETVINLAKKHFQCNYHVNNYTLEFSNTLEMLRYIKRSGVSGNRGVLSYKQTKELIKNYPLSYLEFEVVFLYT